MSIICKFRPRFTSLVHCHLPGLLKERQLKPNSPKMNNKYLKFLTITLFCIALTMCQPNSVKDIDDNKYGVVRIGTQIWMKENLKTTRYRNGDLIGTTTPATLVIEDESTPKYQWAYNGNESNVAIHSRLYTWYVATDSRNVCPIGWHVPSDAEWTTLTDYLIKNDYGYGTGYNGMDIAKSLSAPTGWVADDSLASPGNNQKSNNMTGFTALPSGARLEDGNFYNLGHIGNWWSTTEGGPAFMQGLSGIIVNTPGAMFRDIYHDYCYVNSYSNNKKYGMSIRCLKDN
jgi:uncharacterized protein (TIGR02145 family)